MKKQVPLNSKMYFTRFDRKEFFTIHDEKVGLMRFNERKVRSLVKKCFCVLEWCEKFKFSYFEKFSHFTNFDEMKNLENSNKIFSSLKNLKETLTLGLSSCSPKIKCANESHGVEN